MGKQETMGFSSARLATLDRVMKERYVDGGALPGLIVGDLDRDGVSPEAGPGYALSWGVGFAEVANLISDYPAYTKQNLYRDFPQFGATFASLDFRYLN